MKKILAFALLITLISTLFAYGEENNYEIGSTIIFGHYEQDGNTANGKEPIEWQVLSFDSSDIFVIASKGLEVMPYSAPGYGDEYKDQNYSWESSYIRSWLNDDFLEAAFTEEERNDISVRHNKLNDASGYVLTQDNVFCC